MSGEVLAATQPLGDLVEILSGFPFKSDAFSTDPSEGTPLIRIRDIKTHTPSCSFIGDYDVAYLIGDGDIIIGMDGEFTAVRWQGVSALLNQRVLKIRSSRPDLLDDDYLFHRIQSDLAHLETVISGTTVKHLSVKDIRRLEWLLPPLHEQRRIAEVLRSVDKAHSLNGLALSHLRLLRKLALRDLFTPTDGEDFEDSILGPLPCGWAALPAEDICDAVINCKNRTPPITETGFAVVRTPNVRDGRFVRHNLVRTDPNSFEEWTRRGRPKAGDVLITREAPIGEVCAVPDDEPICLGQRMMLYRPDPTKLDSSFLLYALQSKPVQEHLRNLGGGSTVGHVRVGDIRRLPIPCPPLATQIAVAKMLEEIDVALDHAAGSFSQTAGLKNSLASDLLSGRVRVPA